MAGYTLKNYMEDIVIRNLTEQLENRADIKADERFRMDVIAMSLNQLPPKYVVTDKGHIYTKLQQMEVQFNADVTRVVLKAIESVKNNPRK